jgi:hypothetical protein
VADIPDYEVQPAPVDVEGAVSSHDLVIADLEAWGWQDLTEPAIASTRGRKDYGLAKYDGKILHKDNGRDHAKDAEDEAGDLVVYLRSWMDQHPAEAPQLFEVYQDALWGLVAITQLRATGEVPPYLAKTRAPLTPHPDVCLLHETDNGLALRGDIPYDTDWPLWVCGAMLINEQTCVRPLGRELVCDWHGQRRVA